MGFAEPFKELRCGFNACRVRADPGGMEQVAFGITDFRMIKRRLNQGNITEMQLISRCIL
jgi:hypothetical protein